MNGPDIHREAFDDLEDRVLAVGLGGWCRAWVWCWRSACSLAPTTRDPVEIRAVLKPGETILAPEV